MTWVRRVTVTGCAPGYYCSGYYNECFRVCRPGGSDCAAVGGYCVPFSDYGSSSPWGFCV